LRQAAAGCHACPLWKLGTQTVFGEGPAKAKILLIGEQPGDQEDLAGKPFVGPAGKLLDRALAEAGVERAQVYVTNAVKHFKWAPRGKRRLHQKPSVAEQAACRPWLLAELEAVRPDLIICLGATATQSIFGNTVRVMKDRGRIIESPLGKALVTIHPSALLRLPPGVDREPEFQRLVADLRVAVEKV
jgi:DNA polymerase